MELTGYNLADVEITGYDLIGVELVYYPAVSKPGNVITRACDFTVRKIEKQCLHSCVQTIQNYKYK